MKVLIFIFVVSFALATNKELLSAKSMATGDLLGEAFNFNGKAHRAIAYGIANTGGYDENYVKGIFIKPEMVALLPDKIDLPRPGPMEVIEEIPSTTNYYDGSTKLNKITINCKIYANPSDCLHSSNCGWCGSVSGCVAGTNLGPLEPCVKTSYIFSAPFPNWNPQSRVINENIGGMSLTVINK